MFLNITGSGMYDRARDDYIGSVKKRKPPFEFFCQT